MNRTEAYEILISRLQEHSANGVEEAPASEFHRGGSGVLYEISFGRQGNLLKGSIHDHNTQRFELLEEVTELKEPKRT